MIWPLVKRDPAWLGALIGMVLSAAVCALAHEWIWEIGPLVGMFWLQCQPERRATDFQAALPIPASDLFLARILSFFALVWLPVASGTALLLLARRPAEDAATLVEMGAALSVLVLVAQSSRLPEIAGSGWASPILAVIVLSTAYPISVFVPLDRKSTRLNSSHLGISYAVFC